MYRRIASCVAIPLLVVACSTSGAGRQPRRWRRPGQCRDHARQRPGGGNGLASVDLTITGGDYAGHYVVDLVGSGGCSTGVVGPGTFTVASVTLDPASSFVGPQITIYDADAAVSGTDVEFSAAFPFDNYAYTVEVNPYLSRSQGSDFGSGTATLDNRGSTATLTIEGTSASGEAVSATIECHQVTNF
jgi:hypothetical protein